MRNPIRQLRSMLAKVRGLGYFATQKVLKPLENPAYTPNKGKWAIWLDNLKDYWAHGTTERGYWMYGFYNLPRNVQSDYIDYATFMSRRHELNLRPKVTRVSVDQYNYICLLRDKFVFGKFLSQLGFPVAKDCLLVDGKEGTVQDISIPNGEKKPIEQITRWEFDGFLKIISGECGKGIYKLTSKDGVLEGDLLSPQELIQAIGDSMFVVQQRLNQHESIAEIYPLSINTIRLITIMSPSGDIMHLPAVMRFGANGNVVDNWAAGGIVVGIDNNGQLMSEGKYEWPIDGVMVTTKHPDTGVEYLGRAMPFYHEAVDLAKRLHRFFYGVPCIGWDIAITEKGPVFLEGNDNFEITLTQAVHGGLKRTWLMAIGDLRGGH